MGPAEIHQALQQKLGDSVREARLADVCDPSIEVTPDALGEAAQFLRDEPSLAFDSLQLVSGVDTIEPAEDARIEVLYHLYSFRHKHKIVLRVRLGRDTATVPSVVSVWPAAEWLERETYDLVGVAFEGNPDLTRILLPEDWEGHPLRKDYEFPKAYGGIQNIPPGERE